jgi:hypothetical protein
VPDEDRPKQDTISSEFNRFRSLAERLFGVPKSELDAETKRVRPRKRVSGESREDEGRNRLKPRRNVKD